MNGLLFITHRTERYTYMDSVRIALEGGCRQIQLRMKESPVEEIEKTAFAAKQLCDTYQAALYIDDQVEICKKAMLTGVHLGKADMDPKDARKLLGNTYMIGGTANTFEDILSWHAAGVNYIGLGPFRFTQTKKKLSPLLGLSGYKEILKKCKHNAISLPVLAIGGINKEDIPELMNTGISGIALSSTILMAENPVEETKEIIHIIKQYQS
ncbi:MAG: thiamine phosphate synthase [Candidatus Azobacteroides sp.]|nr:thiamine phosphate synthase [Candidatus Azobacteroides sp.]